MDHLCSHIGVVPMAAGITWESLLIYLRYSSSYVVWPWHAPMTCTKVWNFDTRYICSRWLHGESPASGNGISAAVIKTGSLYTEKCLRLSAAIHKHTAYTTCPSHHCTHPYPPPPTHAHIYAHHLGHSHQFNFKSTPTITSIT